MKNEDEFVAQLVSKLLMEENFMKKTNEEQWEIAKEHSRKIKEEQFKEEH